MWGKWRVIFLSVLAWASLGQAQAPDIIYVVTARKSPSTNVAVVEVPQSTSWSYTEPSTCGSSTWTLQGSEGSLTLSGSAQCTTTNSSIFSKHIIWLIDVYSKNGATVLSTGSGNGECSVEVNGGITRSGTATYGFTQPLLVDLYQEATGTQSGTGSYGELPSGRILNPSCSASAFNFPAYPGVTYKKAGTLPATALFIRSARDVVTTSAESTASYASMLGAASPVAILNGPQTSGGAPIARPSLGQTGHFSDISYDPDNLQAGQTTAGAGICSRTMTVYPPDGGTPWTTTSPSPSYTFTKQGHYRVDLTVIDNEGMSSTTSKDIFVGPVRPNSPNDNGCENACQSCGSSDPIAVEACVDICTGNLRATVRDPVRTRSYPLTVNLHVNSQSGLLDKRTIFQNASFTYGISLREELWYNGNTQRLVLVDGDGSEFDFGDDPGSPVNPTGFFGTLSPNSSGWTLSSAGAPESIEAAGNFTYEFNSGGYLTEIIDPAGNVQELTYSGAGGIVGALVEVKDLASNKRITFDIDPLLQRATRIVRGEGASVTELSYDASTGLLENIAIKDAADNVVRSFSYDYTDGELTSIEQDGDPSTTLTIAYQSIDEISGGGQVKRVKSGNISSATSATRLAFGDAPFSGAAFRTTRKTTGGGVYLYDLNALGDLIRWQSPNLPKFGSGTISALRTYTYDGNRKLTSMNDGTTTYTFTRDALGQTTQEAHGAEFLRNYTYSGTHLTGVSDSIGPLWTIGYTDTNHPNIATTFTNALGATWTRTLNSHGQVTSLIPPTGSPSGTTVFNYDENSSSPSYGWLESVVNGAGEVVSLGDYTMLGDIGSITTSPASGISNTTSFTYDAAQRRTATIYPDSKSTIDEYTGRDLTSITDEAGTETEFTYCPSCGKLTGISASLGRDFSWTLNGDNQETVFQDARANQTNYAYGPAGVLTQLTFPDSRYLLPTYDNRANVTRLYNGDLAAEYIYGPSQRLSTFKSGAGDYNFTYNSDNTIATVGIGGNSNAYAYTADRRLLSDTFTPSATQMGTSAQQKVEYTYNPDGSVATLTWRHQGNVVVTWTYGYDLAGRVTSVANSFGETTTFAYDGEGKLLSQTNANGTVAEYEYYEPRGWVTSIEHKLSGTPFESYSLEYDSGLNTVGNLTQVTELDGSVVSYDYDGAYRLIEEERTGTAPFNRSYGYDLAGNLTEVDGAAFASYDAANKISSLTGGSVSHRANGAINALSGPGITSVSSMLYSAVDKLTEVNLASGWKRYLYDHLGRRRYSNVSYVVDTRIYISGGNNLIGELKQGAPDIAYTWGPAGLISSRKLSGTPASRWYHFGPQGETRQLTDGSGNVTSTYRYSAYGVTLGTTGSDYNPFRYKGKFGYYTDIHTGMMLAGQRWYQPVLARWTTRDPILFEGGYNLYQYVEGNPVRFTDPDGLAPFNNASQRPVLVKPEKAAAYPRVYCAPGATCDVDGVFDNGPNHPPVKIPNGCTCEMSPDGKSLNVTCPLWSEWSRFLVEKMLGRRSQVERIRENLPDWSPNPPSP